MSFSPTDDQLQALEALVAWHKSGSSPYITLGGYAGTGKTTLIGVLRKLLYKKNPKLKVAFCAYTGKAVRVMENYLKSSRALSPKDSLSTIHGLIYEMIHDERGKILSWRARDEIKADLIIVDEASMVSRRIWEDLLSYKVPIVAVGDHGQLPPIEGKFSLMEEPNLRLEKIHRQAARSPIIQLSQLARTEGRVPVGEHGVGVMKYSRTDYDIHSKLQELLENWNERTLYLVGMNWTRKKLNQQIRMQRERNSPTPQIGDRVICLRNNWEVGIYNGMLGTIKSLQDELNDDGEHHWYMAEIKMDDGTLYKGKISKHQFEANSTQREVPGLLHKQVGDLFDFGYALTVHKAQGSQARKVVVFEERNKHMDDEAWRRWLYTAVTRAEEELVIIGE